MERKFVAHQMPFFELKNSPIRSRLELNLDPLGELTVFPGPELAFRVQVRGRIWVWGMGGIMNAPFTPQQDAMLRFHVVKTLDLRSSYR